eukprot:Skav210148  [mRNA]  locus=scaffold268:189827:194253:+ [translate_table: standard]
MVGRCTFGITSRPPLVAGGILLALLSACASAFVIRAVLGEQRPPEEGRAAADGKFSGQSGMMASTCRQLALPGLRKMDTANSITDCCLSHLRGWIFEHLDKRCRWVHFVDEASPVTRKVCNENPGAMSCRCFTSRGIAFSFKPPAKTHLIWVDTNWE